VLLEAVPAVHRLSFRRLEGHLALLLALGANRIVHFARAAEAASPSPVFKSHFKFTYFSLVASCHLFRHKKRNKAIYPPPTSKGFGGLQ
jgi:hypothetical protein